MRKHRKNRRNKRIQKNIIVAGMIGIICMLGIGYAAFSTNFLINGKGTIVDKSRMIQSWTKNSNEDFHTDFYKENIVSATFLDSNAIPSNAVENWDVSANKDKGVMAYVVESSSEAGKYDLFIGANDGVIANENSGFLFYNFKGLTSINFNNNFDTSNTTNMNSMFSYCTSINIIDLSSFDTTNVNSMENTFGFFDNVTGHPVENNLSKIIFGEKWVMSNVTNMFQMFVGCTKLIELDVSNWDTSNVKNMASAFAFCGNLTSIDVSNWNTSNVEEMSWLFMSCQNLREIDVSNFDTSNVTGMRCMFQGCLKLTGLNLCSFNTSKVKTMYAMFNSTSNLTKIKVGTGWTTANADTTVMFSGSGVSSVTTGQCQYAL